MNPDGVLHRERQVPRKCGVPSPPDAGFCGAETDVQLHVPGVDYWDGFGNLLPVCHSHAQAALSAAQMLFRSATLWQQCEKQVTRYGFREFRLEDVHVVKAEP